MTDTVPPPPALDTPATGTIEQRMQALEDREAIRDLDARYCRHLDDGRWDELVGCFTAEGVFDGLSRVQGHPALRTFFATLADGGLTAFWHHVTNLEISLDTCEGTAPRTAVVRSLLWQPCVLDGTPHVAAGRYRDELVHTDEGWRYRYKHVRFSYFAPLSEGWDTHRFTIQSARAAALRPDGEERYP